MKTVSIVTPCFNEEDNIQELYHRIVVSMAQKNEYNFEIIFIDNASTDRTQSLIREIAAKDARVKAIFNTRNFGHIRSPYHGLLQATGDVAIMMASDLQDPPERLPEFIEKWEQGYKIVVGVKNKSEEFGLFYAFRTMYYRFLRKLTDVNLFENFTGFGLYDQMVIDTLRKIDDPYPYFRGLIADIGYETATVTFTQPRRKRGISKNNFYTLYDIAMLGITSYTKVPLRMATMFGFFASIISFLIGLIYLFYKLVNWQNFSLGIAPVIIGLFFMGSVQLLFLGVLGEYIGSIYTQVQNRPHVIEKERINF